MHGQRLALGVAAGSEMVRILTGEDIRKALNPIKNKDFERIIERMGKAMNEASIAETKALRDAIESLDGVDWENISDSAADKIFISAAAKIAASATAVAITTDRLLEKSGPSIVTRTKAAEKKKYSLAIKASMSLGDKRVVDKTREDTVNFVTDSIGVRSDKFDKQARKIVGDGLEAGTGRRELAKKLKEDLAKSGLARKTSYYDTVAAAFSNRSRTWGQLSAYQDADIRRFTFEAMLDEVTTNVCRMMHGRTFTVASAVKLYESAETFADPSEIKDVQPWVTDSKDSDGNEIMQISVGGEKKTVGRVVESAVGRQDKTGKFSNQMSDTELIANGVIVPPLHGACRSILVPDF